MPEWAQQIEVVEETVKEMNTLLGEKEEEKEEGEAIPSA